MGDKKGFSLVELIVVIAVMSVLAGVMIVAFANLSKWRLNQCASSLEDGLTQTKADALSQDNVKLVLSKRDGLYYLEVRGVTKKFGDADLSIKYVRRVGTTEQSPQTLGDGESLEITFRRDSGAFAPIEISGVDEVYCTTVTMSRKGYTREMILVPPTGKFYWN